MIIDVPQFLALRSQLPVVDVRSEGEYDQGHIPNALNVPLLNNSERVIVGTTYKQQGQQEAIKAGFSLVGPRLLEIIEATEQIGSEFIVHCWRGGMRSSNFCQFVGMARMKTHQLKGGYKAYRQMAVDSFKHPYQLLLLSGFTGSGKSDVLRALRDAGEQVIDLEMLAHHKGSAFGGLGQLPQPTTEQFQNNLFEELLKLDTTKRVWVEDESIAVGKIFLPADFWKTMNSSPVIRMEVPKPVRVARLVNEYGNADKAAFTDALKQITKRLGGQHFNAAIQHVSANNMEAAIDIILNYYDKAYSHGLSKKSDRVRVSVEWDGLNIGNFVREIIANAERIAATGGIKIKEQYS